MSISCVGFLAMMPHKHNCDNSSDPTVLREEYIRQCFLLIFKLFWVQLPHHQENNLDLNYRMRALVDRKASTTFRQLQKIVERFHGKLLGNNKTHKGGSGFLAPET